MNKTVLLVGGVLAIAFLAFLYVQARNSNARIQPLLPKSVQLTPTSQDVGSALRGPSRSVNTSPALHPTSVRPTRRPLPTKETLPTSTPKPPAATVKPTEAPTPTRVPTSIPIASPTPTPSSVPSSTSSQINYAGSGFSPASTTVRVGTWVTFRNYSTAGMKIIGDSATLAVYPNFGERVAVGQYGFYQFQFSIAGNFPYRNEIFVT